MWGNLLGISFEWDVQCITDMDMLHTWDLTYIAISSYFVNTNAALALYYLCAVKLVNKEAK